MRAVVVDKNYGSVTPEELEIVREAYAKAGITLAAEHYTTEDEIIAGCADAQIILGEFIFMLFHDQKRIHNCTS